MKKIIILPAILFLSTIISASGSTLTVTLKNLNPVKGNVMVALCNSEENFKEKSEPFKKQKVSVTGSSVKVVFPDLPAGDYAVKVMHDENSNGKFDTNIVGIPKEAFGFSNDVMGKVGPPKFSQAKVRVDGDKSISITMKKM